MNLSSEVGLGSRWWPPPPFRLGQLDVPEDLRQIQEVVHVVPAALVIVSHGL